MKRIIAHHVTDTDPRQSGKAKLEKIPCLTLGGVEAAPTTMQDVYNPQFKNVWLNMINKKKGGLKRDNTRRGVDTPPVGEKAVDRKWIFQWKTDEHGYVIKAKTRLVLGGNRQKIDDIPTFSRTPLDTANRLAAAGA